MPRKVGGDNFPSERRTISIIANTPPLPIRLERERESVLIARKRNRLEGPTCSGGDPRKLFSVHLSIVVFTQLFATRRSDRNLNRSGRCGDAVDQVFGQQFSTP